MWRALIVIGLVALACHRIDGPGDADAGGVDTGSDADGDTDADGDADADAECEPCQLNEGYPCHCDADPCLDGSRCAKFHQGDAWGMCLPACENSLDCIPPVPQLGCGAQRACSLESEGVVYCTLKCAVDGDCPPGLTCESPFGAWMCYGGTGLDG